MQQKKISSVVYGGGIDQVTPPVQVEPGRLLRVKNFECDLNNGYKLMAGYERVDGRPSPTDTPFFAINLDSSIFGQAAGVAISGVTSGATALLVQESANSKGMYMTNVVGTFLNGEDINVGIALTQATSVAFQGITLTDDDDFNLVRFAKEQLLKSFIAVVPGEGPILGTWRHLEHHIAFRNKVGGATAGLYKATTSGWVEITLEHIIFFDTGLNDFIVGELIDDGIGNTATVEAVSYTTVSNTAGYIVVSGFTAGFAIAAVMIRDSDSQSRATVTIAAAQMTLLPGGRYEFRSHNFFGGVTTYNVYACDGVNPGFQYNPVTELYVPLYTDQANRSIDTPTFVAIYRNHLFFEFARGIMRNSEPGEPALWDAAAGSLEIGIGAEPTGFDETPTSLIVATRRTTYQLLGTVAENFELAVASQNTGAIKHTVQHIGTTYMLDDRGIIELLRVQAFGNFENATVSRLIQPTLNALRANIIASTISLNKNIYRLIASDGQGISMTQQADGTVAFSVFELSRNVTCAANAEDELGTERIYFGADDGFVYEWDKGRSFDGDIRESWAQPAYHFLKSITTRKRFFRMFLDVILDGRASISAHAEFSLGSLDVEPVNAVSVGVQGVPSAWDIGKWEQALFDARISSDAYYDLTGTGDSIGVIFYHSSATDDLFTLKDITYHYKFRRAMRAGR